MVVYAENDSKQASAARGRILSGANVVILTGVLQAVKEIEKMYEAASKVQDRAAEYSVAWKEFKRYTDALPQEAWIS